MWCGGGVRVSVVMVTIIILVHAAGSSSVVVLVVTINNMVSSVLIIMMRGESVAGLRTGSGGARICFRWRRNFLTCLMKKKTVKQTRDYCPCAWRKCVHVYTVHNNMAADTAVLSCYFTVVR